VVQGKLRFLISKCSIHIFSNSPEKHPDNAGYPHPNFVFES